MRISVIFTIAICCIVLFACKKDDPIRTFGQDVLTSNKYAEGQTYYVNGFSFATAASMEYILGGGTETPDLILNEIIDQYGTPYQVYMSSPSNYQAFKLYGSYINNQEAEDAYSEYQTVTETQFTDKTASLVENTIYTYKSKDGKYAKILIKGVQLINTSGIQPFFSISIKWTFQPDGTTSFWH